MNWYLKAWKNTFNFSGRARCKEFWYFILVLVVFLLAPFFIGLPFEEAEDIYGVLFFVHIITLYSVTIRRLHDINLSGWWVLLATNPLGMVVFGYLFMKDSYFNYNQWGPVPKEVLEDVNEP